MPINLQMLVLNTNRIDIIEREKTPEEEVQIKQRAKELGIEKIINSKTGQVLLPQQVEHQEIAFILLKQAKKMEKRILHVDEKDFNKAINFLKLFAVYADNGPDPLYLDQTFRKAENKQEALDLKTINILYNLSQIQAEATISKSMAQSSFDILKKDVNKLMNTLPIMEKTKLTKSVRKSINILKRYLA